MDEKKKTPIIIGAIPSEKQFQNKIFKIKKIIEILNDKKLNIKPKIVKNLDNFVCLIKPNIPKSNKVKKLFFVLP